MIFSPINLIAILHSDCKSPKLLSHEIFICGSLSDIPWSFVNKWETFFFYMKFKPMGHEIDLESKPIRSLPYFCKKILVQSEQSSTNDANFTIEEELILKSLKGVTSYKNLSDISTELLISSIYTNQSKGQRTSNNQGINEDEYCSARIIVLFYLLSHLALDKSLNPQTALYCRRIVKYYYEFKLKSYMGIREGARQNPDTPFSQLSFARITHIIAYTMASMMHINNPKNSKSNAYLQAYKEIEFSIDNEYGNFECQGISQQLEPYLCYLLDALPQECFPENALQSYFESNPIAKRVNQVITHLPHKSHDNKALTQKVFRSRAKLYYLESNTNLLVLLSSITELSVYWQNSDVELVSKYTKIMLPEIIPKLVR